MSLFFTTSSEPVINAIDEALAETPKTLSENQELANRLLVKAQPHLHHSLLSAIDDEPPSTPQKRRALATHIAKGVPAPAAQKIAWDRISLAGSFLGIIFIAAIYTSHDENMKDFSKPLLDTFTVLLSAMAGLITGEASKN